MAEHYDVAVIGGGVIGLSIARALLRAGPGRVVVLEREAAMGRGSSERANGGFRAQFTTPINIAFSLYSIGELEELDRIGNGTVGLHQTGYLLMAGTEPGAEQLRVACELQRSLGVDTEWLTPDEARAKAPLIRVEDLRAATFHRRDGFLDPHGVVAAMKDEVKRLGAETGLRSQVVALEERADGTFDITTTAGSTSFDTGQTDSVVDVVRADWVVNASGAHAKETAAMLGVDVPVEPVRRNLAFIPDASSSPGPASSGGGLIPMCVDLDTGVLVRRETGGGYVIAYSDPEDEPGWDTSVDPRFLGQVAERIGNRFPTLASLPIDPQHCWAGLYPETPDHHAIVGRSPGHERFIQCVGFGGHGIMHSPAAGKAVAELVMSGTCTTFDLHPLRVERFAEGDLVVETAVL